MTSTTDDLVLAGRFACQRLLKSGRGVNTYEGVDLEGGGRVIVKTADADAVSPAVSLRVAHEALILRRLERPDFTPLVAVGRDDDVLYLVQPYVPGVTLQARLAAGGPLSVDSAIAVAVDVLRALQHAHDGDVLHRDVKPANVIVGEEEPIQRAVLIDFGFARSAWLDSSIRDEPVGTVRYLAPEAAGALGATVVDERADLYALGVLLFECLAGRPPFDGRDVGEVLRQHLNAPPPPLGSVRADVPRAVEGVVQRLLRKDPDERYQSAAAALADLELLAAGRARGLADPPVVVGMSDRRQALTEPSFVGRVAELAVLSDLVEQARLGHGRLVLVEADSGGGKTRLLDELVRRAGPGIWVLRGQGVDQAARRPFQVLEGVGAGIVAAVDERPELGQMLRVRLGDAGHAAAAALPALAPLIAPGGPADVGPEAYGQIRSVNALTALLDALGDAGHPVVVLLDDCQWADELSLRLLASWAHHAASSVGHVLVLAAFRSEEVGPDSLLRAIPAALHVELGPFDDADVRSLAESMAGPLPPEAVDVVAQLAEGSPFMAAAVLRGLVESGALVNASDGWHVDPTLLASAQTSRRAALFLLRRMELLSPSALSLLSVGAVLGKEFDLGLAVELTGQDGATAAAGLRDAVRRRILWVDEQSGHCSFRHDKLREALLDRLDDAARSTLHLRAAHRLEATDRDRCFELAYHFDAGGRSDRALPYALAAADAARRRHALEVAVDHYRIAERAGVTDAATRAQVAEGLGDVLTLQGEYEEAATYLEEAKALVKRGGRSAELEGKLGDVAFKRGNHPRARQHLEGALRQLGRRAPRTTFGFLLLLCKELFVQIAHTVAPRLLTGRRSLEGSEEEFLAIRIYSRLAYVYWFHAGKIPCGWAHLREMNLAERYPATEALAQAYSEHAPVATMIPWYGRGIAYVRRSLAIRRSLGNVWGEGQSLGFYGAVLYSASRYQECIDSCEEAARLLDRTGDRWEANTARWHTAFAYYRLGELGKAVSLAKALHASALGIGDTTAAGVALSVWSRASGGDVPAELVAAALAAGTDDAHTATEVRVAEGVRLLAEGSVDDAIAMFDEAYRVMRQAGLRQEYVAPVLPWLATALRVRAEQLPPFRSLRHRAQLRRAAEVSRRGAMTARDYQNNRPHALREQALVAAMRGRGRRARRLFTASLAIADRQGAAYEYALTEAAWGRVGESMGWPGAGERRAQAEADLRALTSSQGVTAPAAGDAPSISLADRFDSLLEVGRRIGSAPSARAVYDAVTDAALTLLRGERCEITAVGDVGAEDISTGVLVGDVVDDPVSRTLVQRALATRGPVVSGEERDAGAADSVVLLGLRSVLCAPIYCGDRPVACFSVVHHDLGDLFSDDEVRLAEFIATLAGAALEALAGTEARFRSLAQNSSDVITIVDPDGIVVYCSSSVQRVFGLRPHEVVGRSFADWAHPEDAATVAAALAAAGAGRVLPLLECRLGHADGSWHHVETALNDLFDDPGVRGLVLNSRDVSERKALEDELRRRALHDDLTGLANRGLFADRIAHVLSSRSKESLALVFLDLDDFKGINDSLGHAAGDKLLKDVARRLLTCVRPQDTVARLGGDEFAILLEGADEERARKVADRVLAAMAPSFELEGQQVNARTSVGVAVATGDAVDASDLLSRADAAMYVAKARGKGQYKLFEPSMRVAAVERVTIRNDLQWAVQSDEMDAYYQPLIDLRSGGVVGFEAVLRWRHPVRGLLSPAEFIEVAEDSGLIVPIGAWTLRQACREGRRLQRSHPERPPFGMSVNVSTRQLQHPRLLQEVEVALAESGFDPTLLTLEITESATVHDTEATIRKLEELKALGLRLAIDDFGTGYSSLSYLRRFPVDQLKIDRSFVSGLGRDDQDTAIVTSVISLAHALGLEAVAEGVETMEQLEALTVLGCDLAQGYNWRRPAAFDDVDAWLTPSATFLGLGTGPLGPAAGPADGRAVRTLLVDDREQLRAAIRLALELDGHFTVVGEASDGREAIAAAALHQPDLVVLDLMMPGMGGLQALAAIHDAAPGTAIVLLTSADQADIPEIELRHTVGLLDKTLDLDALVRRLSGLLQIAA
ncbi:MAG: EAL domain-containing protein [Acidimicrobiia bacterium]